MVEAVETVVRVMPRGSGFPSLVQTTSGRRFVMKLSGVGQGVHGLITELIATRLAGALGLRVPSVVPLMLSRDLPWQVGTDEFFETLQRSTGWNLGVEFVEGADDASLDELGKIPAEFLDQLSTVDTLLQNVDRTVHNPNLLRDREGAYWAIDFGACLFLDRFARDGARMSFALPANHFLAGHSVRRLSLVRVPLPLREIVSDIPDAWFDQVPNGRQGLLEQLSAVVELYIRQHG